MRGRVGFMGRRVREGTCCLHAGTGAREGIWRLHGDLWASEGTACLKHRGAVRGRVIFLLVRRPASWTPSASLSTADMAPSCWYGGTASWTPSASLSTTERCADVLFSCWYGGTAAASPLKQPWRSAPLKPQRVALLKRCFASWTLCVAASRCGGDAVSSCLHT